MVFDTDKVEDIHRWSNEAFDHSIEELIEDPIEHLWHHFNCDNPEHHHDDDGSDVRARDTTVRFAQADYQRSDYARM